MNLEKIGKVKCRVDYDMDLTTIKSLVTLGYILIAEYGYF